MSKGHNRRDELKQKKGETSRPRQHKKGHDYRNYTNEESVEKRPSVFDRLGSKGFASSSKSKISSTERSSQKLNRIVKKDKHRSRKYKPQKSTRRRKESSKSSDESSSDQGSSSSSPSSSSTETSTSSTAVTTTSSSSVPSVKIRHKKKRLVQNIQKEVRKDQKKYEAEKERKHESENERNSQFERPRPQDTRPETFGPTKRKAPPDTRTSEDWKQGRYELPPPKAIPQPRSSPRRSTPPPDAYIRGRSVGVRNRDSYSSEPDRNRDRIRIVPPSYGTARPLPLDVPHRYSSLNPSARPSNRNYQDFRGNIEDKRQQRERLAPARSDRIIPPLLPESELRRPSKFSIHESNRGYNFQCAPQPLLPQRRELPVLSSPKYYVPKLEESVLNRVDEWVGETVSPSKTTKVEEKAAPPSLLPIASIPVEEELSEISDFEEGSPLSAPAPPSEKEELEVTSTLVDETGNSAGDGGPPVGGDSPREDSILENMDFEQISEDEFEDGNGVNKKLGIVDALGVDWSVLLRGRQDSTTAVQPKIRRRESAVVELLKRTGLHRSLVNESLFERVLNQLGEIETHAGLSLDARTKAEELEKPSLRRRRLEREELIDNLVLGPGSRALSLRRDLAMRHHLLGFDLLSLDI